jgi:rubrerythrin
MPNVPAVTTRTDALTHMIGVLRSAYSGELAAAWAYRGHWRSLRDPAEREAIARIEREEWEHRAAVLRMLQNVDAKPQRLRDTWMRVVGLGVAGACFVIGRFFSMYFAGRLESSNIAEYVDGAMDARTLGRIADERAFEHMARVEAEHERFFRDAVEGHPLLPAMQRFFPWSMSTALEDAVFTPGDQEAYVLAGAGHAE